MPSQRITPQFDVIIDTREKKPWDDLVRHSMSIRSISYSKLEVGDYAIKGLEHILCIERKGSVDEFANNTFDKRFIRELIKMGEYPYKFLLFEFSMDDLLNFPNDSKIAKDRLRCVKVTPKYMMRLISEIQISYGISVIFCGNTSNAKYIATNIMRRVVEKHEQ